MDILRSPHLTSAQVTSDTTSQTWLRWYPAAPGARAFPGWHAFGDPVWESDFPTPDGVGCYAQPLIWRPKKYPAPPGQHYLGQPDWFLNGIPSADLSTPPIAATCQGIVQSAQGGTLIGGSAWQITPNPSPQVLTGTVSRSPVQLPDWQYVSVQHNSTPSSVQSISGYQPSTVCMCVTPSTEIIYMITSCLTYNALVVTLNDLVLPVTQTPWTKYDVQAVNAGTTITGIVPQVLRTGPQVITIVNAGAIGLTIAGSDARSQVANRITLPPVYGGTVTLAPEDSITLFYNPCASSPQWITQACTVDVDYTLPQILAYIQANFQGTVPTIWNVLAQGVFPIGTTWTTLPVSVSLGNGTYVLIADFDVSFEQGVNQGQIGARGQIYDATAGGAVPNSQLSIFTESAQKGQTGFANHGTRAAMYEVFGGPHTITLQAQYTASDPDASVSVLGDGSQIASATSLVAIKVG